MGRLLLTIGLGVSLFLAIAWYFDLLPAILVSVDDRGTGRSAAADQPKAELGKPLYKGPALPPLPRVASAPIDPVFVKGHLTIVDKLDVASDIDGRLLFVGEEVDDGAIAVAGSAAFVSEPFQFARVEGADQDLLKFYRQIKESDTVSPGQMLALLNPAKALNEVAAKRAELVMAEADHKAAVGAWFESTARYERQKELWIQKATSRAELSAAEYMVVKFREESKAKEAGIKVAKIKVDLAHVLLKYHYIYNEIPYGESTVKTIIRQRGESVKQMEPIMQLYSEDRLRAEGLVDAKYQGKLWRGMPVAIEPAFPEPPMRPLYAHRQEVTSVAVNKNTPNPLIVSASRDKTVCVWSLKEAAPLNVLYHPDSVQVVACPPKPCPKNWMLSGCADGSIRIWNLDKLEAPLSTLEDAHQDGVTALAFSPDGTWFASGGADNNICLWHTATGKLVYSFDEETDPHQGTVTSLHFTPQGRLVSASRDHTIRVWKLHEKGAELEQDGITGRGGLVSQLGVSNDGRWMLFDQNDTLQVLSVEDGRTMSWLKKPGAAPFETVAAFSPDAQLMLTGASEGRLQLWKAPAPGVRGFEVRLLHPEESSSVTCAAFAPAAGQSSKAEESFAVSGNRDGYVYVWHIPNAADVDQQRIEGLRLSLVERALDAGVQQIRVGVELRNLRGQQRLIPGLPVTLVIDPRGR